jgi:tetratricopeptide (TPR) repeat protein
LIKKVIHIILIAFVLLGCKTKQGTSSSDKNNNGGKNDDIIKELLIKGATEKVLGNNDDAQIIFEKIISLDDKVAVAHFELSEIFEQKRDATQSVAHAKKAVEYAPENEWYLGHLASAYKKTNQLVLAEETYLKLNEKFPGNSSYLFSLAEVYLYQGKLQESLPLYDEIENQMGISEELILHKNKIYLELNQIDSAIAEMHKLIEINPREVRYYGILAEIYENTGNNEMALANYNQILEIDPENGYVHLSLYEFYKYRDQKDKANAELMLAFKNKRIPVINKVEILSEFFINSERNEELKAEAYELLEIVIETHPKESKGYAVYVDYLDRDNKKEEAITMLQKAVELDPANFNLTYQFMMLLTVNGKYSLLAEESKKAIELFPTQSTFYYFNGVANIQNKKYNEAIESLELGKDLVIDNPELKGEFYQYLGDANHAVKNDKQSDFNYDQALEINPNNVFVLNNYSYYLSLRKEKLALAETMSYKANQLSPNNATYMDTHGWVLFVSEKYVDAEIWLQKALDNGGSNSGEVLEHYGDTLFKLGQIEKAVEYWKKASLKGDASEFIQDKIDKKELVE